jgi:hypothetical protein
MKEKRNIFANTASQNAGVHSNSEINLSIIDIHLTLAGCH